MCTGCYSSAGIQVENPKFVVTVCFLCRTAFLTAAQCSLVARVLTVIIKTVSAATIKII